MVRMVVGGGVELGVVGLAFGGGGEDVVGF
jgi:hypothetical protein